MVGSAKGRSMTALDQRLAPEVVAHEHEGDGQAGNGVDDRHDGRHGQRQFEGGHRLGWVTAVQKALQPLLKALVRRAASGRRTSSDR